jgi:ligand-binding sensor domain-containing protein
VKYIAGGEPQELVKLPEHVTAQVILEDHTGALWIGTGADGLLRLKGSGSNSTVRAFTKLAQAAVPRMIKKATWPSTR